MSAGTYNFTVRQGNTKTLTFRLKDADGNPVDLTGSTMVFRAVYPPLGNSLKKSTDDATLTMRAEDGEVDLFLTVSEIRSFPIGGLTKYEIERRIAGTQITLVEGTITVTKGVNDDV